MCSLKSFGNKIYKDNENSNPYDLTDEELYAMYKYVGAECYSLNDRLRSDGLDKLSKEDKKWVDTLDIALKKIPLYKGHVARTLVFSHYTNGDEIRKVFVDSFIVGEVVTFEQYLSTSHTKLYHDEPEVILFIYNSEKGHNIGDVRGDEYEVLYDRNSSFYVAQKEVKDGIDIIYLTEA